MYIWPRILVLNNMVEASTVKMTAIICLVWGCCGFGGTLGFFIFIGAGLVGLQSANRGALDMARYYFGLLVLGIILDLITSILVILFIGDYYRNSVCSQYTDTRSNELCVEKVNEIMPIVRGYVAVCLGLTVLIGSGFAFVAYKWMKQIQNGENGGLYSQVGTTYGGTKSDAYAQPQYAQPQYAQPQGYAQPYGQPQQGQAYGDGYNQKVV